MIDWWSELPWWLRYGVGLVFLSGGVFFFLNGLLGLGGICAGIGVVMLVLGGKSESEKKGYRF